MGNRVVPSNGDEGPTLYLLDASIYIFQAHFSPWMNAVDRDGEDQSAFIGFTRFLIHFLQRHAPLHMAVAFDESLFCGFRHDLYPGYKANRVLPDENLARQLKACADLCRPLGIPGWGSKYYEADDIIGMLARCWRDQVPGAPVCIISRDKDLGQLLRGPADSVWDIQRNRRRDRESLERDLGIRAEQLPCYLGLTGDAVDCIPGVPGVGPGAAAALLQHFDSMDALFADLGAVPALGFRGAARCRERLAEFREQARLSRVLATIVQVPDPGREAAFVDDWQEAPVRQRVDPDRLAALLESQRVAGQEYHRLMGLAEALV